MSEYRKNTNNNPFGNNNKTSADTQNTRYPAKDPEQAIKQITDKLEKGIRELYESEKYRNFLNTMSKFHRYSFNNNVLISMQKPDATYVAGYNQWKSDFSRQVKKGERGIEIIAPAPYKTEKEVPMKDPKTGLPMYGTNGEPLKERVEVTVPAFSVVKVFDISQTEGKPLPEVTKILTEKVANYKELFFALRDVSPVPITFQELKGDVNGLYDDANRQIIIQKGMEQSQSIKTCIHEVAHAMLHNAEAPGKNDDRRTKEVQAESIAYTVCRHYGIDTSDYSFGYISTWSKDKELKELKESMDVIRKTASAIIKYIDKKMDRDIDELRSGQSHKDYNDHSPKKFTQDRSSRQVNNSYRHDKIEKRTYRAR